MTCSTRQADDQSVPPWNQYPLPPWKENPAHDPVDHPQHYTCHPSGIECSTTWWFSFSLGNAIKYIWRAGSKDQTKVVEDLKKAVWYLEDEIKRIEFESED
jgi:hypothetical protein